MSDLTEAREWLESRLTFHFQQSGWDAKEAAQKATERIDALLSAHRSALAGETPESLVEAAAKAVMAEMGPFENADEKLLWLGRVTHVLKVAAPILRAPLLVQLQDKEERIKALEAMVGHRDSPICGCVSCRNNRVEAP